jgi:hypothetical protein
MFLLSRILLDLRNKPTDPIKKMSLLRLVKYLWTAPNTLLGLALLPSALSGRGGVQVVCGVMEVNSALIAVLFDRLLHRWGPISAITLGHVILGRSHEALEVTRVHERIHVRQYENWGPFFIPCYLLSSLLAYRRGDDPYRDNRFEREAYEQAGGGHRPSPDLS